VHACVREALALPGHASPEAVYTMNVPQDLAAPTTEGLAKKSSKKLSPLQLKALQALEQFEANVCVPRLSSPAHFSHSRACARCCLCSL
jgi:hypothetical protein